MNGRYRYTADIDLRNVNDAHTFAVASVPARSAVLDVGAADGSVARVLRQMECRVWGVELDAEAAEEAKKWCEDVIVGDVEALNLKDAVDRTFDVILFLDILEHLRDPLNVLRGALELLADGGFVVISLPNVAHAAMRAQLLAGRFSYTETGLLDRTHLRFFDPTSVRRFLSDAGLVVLDHSEVTFPIGGTEIAIPTDRLTPEVLDVLDDEPGSDIYQFLFIAAPAGSAAAENPPLLPARELQKELRELGAHAAQTGESRDAMRWANVLAELNGLRVHNEERRRVLKDLLERSRQNADRLVSKLGAPEG